MPQSITLRIAADPDNPRGARLLPNRIGGANTIHYDKDA